MSCERREVEMSFQEDRHPVVSGRLVTRMLITLSFVIYSYKQPNSVDSGLPRGGAFLDLGSLGTRVPRKQCHSVPSYL